MAGHRVSRQGQGKGRRRSARRLMGLCLAAMLAGAPGAGAQEAAGAHGAAALPAEVRAALQRARVPESALAVVIEEAGSGQRLLHHQARVPVNPASLAKLLTTYAALDLLGPAWTWPTTVHFGGPVREGVLEGDLFIKGSGDPKLVIERVWQLLRRVQQLGVRDIRGDIVLDRSAFAPAQAAAGDFDGDATRPYNVQPDALLMNFHALGFSFLPDAARSVARVVSEPPSPGAPERTVALSGGPCEDWRTQLKLLPADSGYAFAGTYPGACGEQAWMLADPDPGSYAARLLSGLWQELGGRLQGRVRDGRVTASARPGFELRSAPLAETVRDINKFSNNVMAQQLFLSLAAQRAPGSPATAEAARETLRRWVAERIGEPEPGELMIDNGSGLSRQWRVTARWLAHLLQHAWSSPVMPELVSSLPVTGLDGTLRRSRATAGRAHLKTGSLRDVAALAGYVLTDGGRRLVFVAIVQHPNASAARPALDALLQWALRAAGPR